MEAPAPTLIPTPIATTPTITAPIPAATAAATASAAHLRITPAERAFLMEHGYLVKLNVVPEADCVRAQDDFEAALKKVNPAAKAASPQRWTKEELPANLSGIQEILKLAHLPCVKDVRLHPNVVSVWRSLLGTNDICSSWDRVNYMPIGYDDGKRVWHHTDVGPAFARRADVGDYVPIQSYVQVSPTSSPDVRLEPLGNARTADPCIVLWEYSNLAHAQYFHRKGAHYKAKSDSNWHIYSAATIAEWERDGRAYLPDRHPAKHRTAPFPMRRLEVRVPRGAMVFWLSATAHMNTSGSCPNPRFVVYVCFGPRHLVSKRDRENFWTAIREQRCTSHWPCAGESRVFPAMPGYHSNDKGKVFQEMLARLDVPTLTFTPAELEVVPAQP